MFAWLTNIFRPSTAQAVEGQFRAGPYLTNEGWIGADWGWNFWQRGYDPIPSPTTSAMVEACVSAYAQTVAMCPGTHWKLNAKGGRDRVAASALSRILKKPNDYQSISDFLLNATRSLYLDGETFALAFRNNRSEIQELHLMDSRKCHARLSEDGEIFYGLSGNDIVSRRLGSFTGNDSIIVPQRDVLHIKLYTPVSPLKGESPIMAAALDIMTSGAMTAQQARFFMNQARPSQILSTDQVLTKEQVTRIRELWEEQSKGMAAGGTPILTAGLKPAAMQTSNKDAAIADVMRMTDQRIALTFRIPLPVLGINNQTAGSTEELMSSWVASGLGFALAHIEEAIGNVFGLSGLPDEYVEFDTAALLRSNLKDRMDALAKGVQGAILTANEARNSEDLPSVPFGDEPRVQQQVVPLSYGAKMEPPKPPSEKPPAEDPPAEKPANSNEPSEGERNARRESIVRSLLTGIDVD